MSNETHEELKEFFCSVFGRFFRESIRSKALYYLTWGYMILGFFGIRIFFYSPMKEEYPNGKLFGYSVLVGFILIIIYPIISTVLISLLDRFAKNYVWDQWSYELKSPKPEKENIFTIFFGEKTNEKRSSIDLFWLPMFIGALVAGFYLFFFLYQQIEVYFN